MLADREDRERKELRRRERERRKLAYGDVSDQESSDPEVVEESDWSADSQEQQQEEPDSPGITDFNVTRTGLGEPLSGIPRKKGNMSRCSDIPDLAHRFNALRFLAMNLKSQNETLHK